MQYRRRTASTAKGGAAASTLINERIKDLGELLVKMRRLIKQEVPDVVEEWKWRGETVWSHSGIIGPGETYRNIVKFTFAKGSRLKDAKKLFNSTPEGNLRRAIDIHERHSRPLCAKHLD